MSAKKRKTVFALGAFACMVMGMFYGSKSVSTSQSIMTALPTASTTTPAPSMIPSPTKYPDPIYYVDCSASTNGDSSQDSPWNALATVNATTFAPGDQILLMRGTVCVGELWPKGSGVDGNPIIISAYSTGARPIIDGNNALAPVVTIKDQNYWSFNSLEVRNSTGLGLSVDGSPGLDLHGFILTNLYVHDGGLNDGQHLILIGQWYLLKSEIQEEAG